MFSQLPYLYRIPMPTPLPLANWSLRKALATLPDGFMKARVRILYIMLILSQAKALTAIIVAANAGQQTHFTRAFIALACYLTLFKAILSFPSKLVMISHIMLVSATILIWSNIFLFSHSVTLITIQFVFMVILGSFYALGTREGLFYTGITVTPVLYFLFSDESGITFRSVGHELASPGFEIITTLNFATVAFAHYYFFKAFRDNIAEKELLNAQLEVTASEAKKLAEARSNFLATMSHELRTPLNSVVGVTELMLDAKDNKPYQKENLDILRNSALDLLSLINNILDINKLDSGKSQLENVSFNLSEHVAHICSALKIKATDKKLDLVFKADASIRDLNITSDPTRLSQVLYNLIGNAIKFTEKGSVTVSIDTVDQTEDRISVLFSVADTGIGIHPDRHALIFESFTQAEAHITRKYGGTGLGLAIVQQVLTLFNSKIRIDSKPGEGAVFSFTIEFEKAFLSAGEIHADPESKALDHLRILVAEDNDVNKLVLQKQLDNLNVRSVMVGDGMQAYEACLDGEYDAILLDLDMPGWNGYETTKRIRSYTDPAKSNSYLIAFTASVSEQKQIIEHGFNDFLYKPVSMKDLREKLEKVALRRFASDEDRSAALPKNT